MRKLIGYEAYNGSVVRYDDNRIVPVADFQNGQLSEPKKYCLVKEHKNFAGSMVSYHTYVEVGDLSDLTKELGEVLETNTKTRYRSGYDYESSTRKMRSPSIFFEWEFVEFPNTLKKGVTMIWTGYEPPKGSKVWSCRSVDGYTEYRKGKGGFDEALDAMRIPTHGTFDISTFFGNYDKKPYIFDSERGEWVKIPIYGFPYIFVVEITKEAHKALGTLDPYEAVLEVCVNTEEYATAEFLKKTTPRKVSVLYGNALLGGGLRGGGYVEVDTVCIYDLPSLIK